MTTAAKYVKRADERTWDFDCPVFTDRPCPFTSTGWPTKAIAVDRGDEHFHEHKTGEACSSLDEFRAKHGLNPKGELPEGAIRVEDL